ncbi:MAG: dTDP-4-dehydrorhamnose 3,5-epimerase [Acidobacteriota bacterium]
MHERRPLRVTESAIIPGLLRIEPSVFRDARGEYFETYNRRDYRFGDGLGGTLEFVEDDISRSKAGVLRGLHGDERTWKLVQCLSGAIHLVVLDMRPGSPALRRWQGFDIDDRNRHQVLIPAGCANGHYAYSDCLFSYKQSELYRGAEHQFTVRWNDPSIAMEWPCEDPVLSQRDAGAPDLDPP